MTIHEGDIIQVTKDEHEWFGCLLIVSEPKSFGCQAYMMLNNGGCAFFRLKHDDYEVVGRSAIAISSDEDE